MHLIAVLMLVGARGAWALPDHHLEAPVQALAASTRLSPDHVGPVMLESLSLPLDDSRAKLMRLPILRALADTFELHAGNLESRLERYPALWQAGEELARHRIQGAFERHRQALEENLGAGRKRDAAIFLWGARDVHAAFLDESSRRQAPLLYERAVRSMAEAKQRADGGAVENQMAALNRFFEGEWAWSNREKILPEFPIPGLAPLALKPIEDSGLLIGAAVAVRSLRGLESGAGLAPYWRREFEIRGDAANAVADSLEKFARRFADRKTGDGVMKLASRLRVRADAYQTDPKYWIKKRQTLHEHVELVADDMESLGESMQASRGSAADRGFLLGLSAVADALSVDNQGEADLDTWFRHFEVRRAIGDSIVEELEAVLPLIGDRTLAYELQELCRDLSRAAPQEGKGGIDYWIAAVEHQDRVFLRVAERIRRRALRS